MKINKWIGNLNIKFEIKFKKHYHHSIGYVQKKWIRNSFIYGTGVCQVKWTPPWKMFLQNLLKKQK